MTPSATKARGGRPKAWTRDKIVQALRRYAELYGDDFTTACFNPSLGKWRDRPELVERYVAGDPETGAPWPSVNSIKKAFGSFNAAREAAGFSENARGPKPGARRRDGEHAPSDLEVRHVTRVIAVEREGTHVVRRLEGQVRAAERRAATLEREVERLRARKPRPTPKAKVKVKVVKERDLDALRAAKAQAKEARTTATRLAARLERAEATISTVRAEKADLKAKALEQAQRAFKAEERAEALAAAGSEVHEVEVVREVERVVEKVVQLPAPEQETVDEALRAAMLARREADAAVRRAAASDKAYYELAAAVKGEARRLTVEEMRELRASGPAGPAVLGAALKGLAAARSGRGDLRAALTAVATAALTWRDRL